MSNFYNKSPEGDDFSNNCQDMDLGTPVSLESKIRFTGYIDQLLGPIEFGELEINIDGSDGFECVLDDFREVSIGTEESFDSNGDRQGRDYRVSIGEVIIGINGISMYLDKLYVLDPWGTFTNIVQCDQLFDGEMSEEEIAEELSNPIELTRDEVRVINRYEKVTEGEAQELLELIASIPID